MPRDSTDRDLFARRAPTNDLVRVYDRYGREGLISRAEWRQTVLQDSLKRAWNEPNELAGAICLGLDLRCAPDVVHAARHLFEVDANRARGARLLAEALMHSREILEAERLLEIHIEQHGEEAGVLSSLAKLRYSRGRTDRSENLLWRALELDANEVFAVAWQAGIARERGGAAVEKQTLQRIAALPGSWRAQTMLAWAALQDRNLESALGLYADALKNAPTPVPPDLLEAAAADLSSQGHLVEMVNLVGPLFNPKAHGLFVGAKLVRAHIDLGQLDVAARILAQLRGLKKVAWESALNAAEMEIAKARREIADPIDVTPENLRYLGFTGPLWLDPASPAAELFPAKSREGPSVVFLAHTVEWAELDEANQLRGAAHVYGRALPPFLAEQVELCTTARAGIVVPWVTEGGQPTIPYPWPDDRAAALAQNGRYDFVVTGHLKAGGKTGHLELRLVRVSDGKLVGSVGSGVDLERPELDFVPLTRQLLELINKNTGSRFISPPGQYRPTVGAEFFYFLLVLEDLLGVRCAGSGPVGPEFWMCERAIIDRAIRFCLEFPRNVCVRILLAQLVTAMRQAKPNVVSEFREKLDLLQKEHTLSEPTNSVVQAIINGALAAEARTSSAQD